MFVLVLQPKRLVALRPPPVADKGSKALSEITSKKAVHLCTTHCDYISDGRIRTNNHFFILLIYAKVFSSPSSLSITNNFSSKASVLGCIRCLPLILQKYVNGAPSV